MAVQIRVINDPSPMIEQILSDDQIHPYVSTTSEVNLKGKGLKAQQIKVRVGEFILEEADILSISDTLISFQLNNQNVPYDIFSL